MNSLILFIICVLKIQWINCQNPAELGIAPCIYSGNFDPCGKVCSNKPMPINEIPKECTSLIYDGIVFDTHLLINLTDEFKRVVPELIATGKPVYLYVGYTSQKFWIKPMKYVSVAVEQITTIQNELTKIGPSNKIAGLILTGLNYDVNTIHQFDDVMWSSLKTYVNDIKTNNSLQVGFYVNATTLIYYAKNPDKLGFFIFDNWNDIIDYYVIGFYNFNACNEEFKNGIVPLSSDKPEVNSLNSFKDAFMASKISKTKIYFEFSASPTIPVGNDTTNATAPEAIGTAIDTANVTATGYQPICSVTYQKFCENDPTCKSWCVDTADTFFEKGVFAKEQSAKGIVIKYIDTIDPAGKCNCDNQNKFITFSIMLRGYKGEESIKNCLLLNKK